MKIKMFSSDFELIQVYGAKISLLLLYIRNEILYRIYQNQMQILPDLPEI